MKKTKEGQKDLKSVMGKVKGGGLTMQEAIAGAEAAVQKAAEKAKQAQDRHERAAYVLEALKQMVWVEAQRAEILKGLPRKIVDLHAEILAAIESKRNHDVTVRVFMEAIGSYYQKVQELKDSCGHRFVANVRCYGEDTLGNGRYWFEHRCLICSSFLREFDRHSHGADLLDDDQFEFFLDEEKFDSMTLSRKWPLPKLIGFLTDQIE